MTIRRVTAPLNKGHCESNQTLAQKFFCLTKETVLCLLKQFKILLQTISVHPQSVKGLTLAKYKQNETAFPVSDV